MPTYLVYIKKTTAAALVIDSMKPAMGRNKVRTTPGSLTLQLFMAVSFTKEAKRKTWFLCSMPVTEVGFFNSKRKLSMGTFILQLNYFKYLERKGHPTGRTAVIKIELKMLMIFQMRYRY